MCVPCTLPFPGAAPLPLSRLLAELPNLDRAEGDTLTSNVFRSQQKGIIFQLIFSMPNMHGYCQNAN